MKSESLIPEIVPRGPTSVEAENEETPKALVPRPEMVSIEFKYRVAMTMGEMKEIFEAQRQLMREVMEPGTDFGAIPGTTDTRTLFKPGAEKLLILHGYAHEMHKVEEVLNWDAPFFHYRYRCDIYDRRTGTLVGQAYGSCNSRESKYAYRWVAKSRVPPDLDLRLLPQRKQRGTGWVQYRIPNADICDLVNTIDKMAQKRAFVGAVRVCTGASGLFAEEGVPAGDGERGKPLPEVEPIEEAAEEQATVEEEKVAEKEETPGEETDPKVLTKVKLLYNKVNAALQKDGIAAYYRTSEHVWNTLHAEGGLTDKQILSTSETSLFSLLINHAKEASK